MSAIDVSQLLQEVSPETPCGENLEYDPAFRELELAATGKPEQRIGDSVVPGHEPNWSDVKDRAVELMRRTKDLRVAVQLTRSLLRTSGAAGLSEGLALVGGMLERYWDLVYPRLDPEDGNDPTFRLNALANLGDWDAMVRGLREMPLVRSRVLGRFSLRDIEIANGSAPKPADGEAAGPEMSTIESAFAEMDGAELQATASGIHSALENLAKIQSLVNDKVGSAGSVDLSRLANCLQSADRILSEQLARRSPAGGGGGEAGTVGAAAGPGRSAGISGEIGSREDVVRMLDKACDYFKRNEPSSPVPLLLQRAKRLVTKSFVEIMKDMAPGGLSEVKSIGGIETEE
jgi:type VI secretion system protein ImpA